MYLNSYFLQMTLIVFCTGSNLKEICQVITSELVKLNIWFSLNKLSLNVTKTNYMVFGKKNNNSVKLLNLIITPLKE